MGEPLNNYKSVVEAASAMTGRCFSLSPTHITISTVCNKKHAAFFPTLLATED
jgi:adenine C2-methylase RlmN of 23S rRNA A2503 and tRNA A37